LYLSTFFSKKINYFLQAASPVHFFGRRSSHNTILRQAVPQ